MAESRKSSAGSQKKNDTYFSQKLDSNAFELRDSDADYGGPATTVEKEPVLYQENLRPEVIGLTGFSLAVGMLGFMKVGYWEQESGTVLAIYGFFLGGAMQIQAGHYEFKTGDPAVAWVCTVFGWNWLASGVESILVDMGLITYGGNKALAVKSAWFALFALSLFVLSWRTSYVNVVLNFFVTFSFIFEFISYYAGPNPWNIMSGVMCICSGSMAGVMATGVLVNYYYEREVFPFFPYVKKNSKEVRAKKMAEEMNVSSNAML